MVWNGKKCERTDRMDETDGHMDDAKTISLRLRRGITKPCPMKLHKKKNKILIIINDMKKKHLR